MRLTKRLLHFVVITIALLAAGQPLVADTASPNTMRTRFGNGAPEFKIRQQTGHKTSRMLESHLEVSRFNTIYHWERVVPCSLLRAGPLGRAPTARQTKA